MRENYTLIRLYVTGNLTETAELSLPKEQAHYLGTVLRKKTGDKLRVFNGDNGEWQAEITELTRKSADIKIMARLRAPKSCPDIWLLFTPLRKHRTAFIFEKATELGVAEFHPVLTEHTQFPKINPDKARLQIIEAAEQTERLDIPTLISPTKLTQRLSDWPKDRRLFFADESGGGAEAHDTLANTDGPAALLIGPEGGFSSTEREQLLSYEFVTPISLGPRILRADTAALSLLTLWQSAKGDW